ncbi:MAG TPA: hypothetical protein VI731_08665, partial [Bacteroidia bacterium]|nr:hypothetical protein [Bacteroidia bacterium]
MKRIFFCFLLLILSPSLKATHNVAGEITLACVNDDLYKVTITTYTYYPGSWAADRCALKIYWGDGDSSILVRANGPSGLPCSSSEGNGVFQVAEGFPNYKKNEYTGYHTYSPGSYQVMVIDPNRVAGIMNIPNSVNVPFVLMTTLIVNPYFGCNSTPVLTSLPLDNACSGHCYFHNVGAYDPDNDDSLSFAIGPAIGPDSLPLPGYTLPNIPGGGNLSIDPVTGDVAWCNPMVPGDYSLVIYVYEWKKMQLGYVNKSIVRRDMMIHVEGGCNNDNPLIDDLPDLCVDAGTLVTFPVFVNDPDNDLTRLDGFGAVFSNSAPAATLTNSGVLNPVPFTGNFNWQTTCENIRIQPWIV